MSIPGLTDLSPAAPPPTERLTLPSGRVVLVQLPDLWAILSQSGRIPNRVVAAVLDLLVRDGSMKPGETDADIYLRKREEVLGMYALASLCLVEPRLIISGAPDYDAGQIAPRDLAYADLEVLYFRWFRLGRAPAPRRVAAAPDAAGPASAAPAGDDVPPAAEPVPADQ